MASIGIARDEGFKAGLLFGSRCPYPAGTDEAELWEVGWSEGVVKRTGDDWTFRRQAPPSRWVEVLKDFISH